MFIVAPIVILQLVAIRIHLFRLEEWRIDKRAYCVKKHMLHLINFGKKVCIPVRLHIVG